jgi:hypothetical protein
MGITHLLLSFSDSMKLIPKGTFHLICSNINRHIIHIMIII